MNQLISELLERLRPALKSVAKAEQLLHAYWADRIALVWTTEAVHRAANECKTVLNEAQARTILQDLHRHHNAQYGLRWQDLSDAIENNGLGRQIKRRKLDRLIHQDILIVDPPEPKQS